METISRTRRRVVILPDRDPPRRKPRQRPNARYYDPMKNWRKLSRHLEDSELNRILLMDFSKYVYGDMGRFSGAENFPASLKAVIGDAGIGGEDRLIGGT
jgi:hypothetical protein